VRIDRSSERTRPDDENSLRSTTLQRQETTPWLALAAQLAPRTLLYGSWGQGLEAEVAPNRSRYRNAGQSFALRSEQIELGIKHGNEQVEASFTLFDIRRGVTADFGPCDSTASCERRPDGQQHHRGAEASFNRDFGRFSLQASALWLDATRRGAAQGGVNGKRPVNVPERSLRLGGEWRPAVLRGVALQVAAAAESDRVVLPYDETVRIAGWSRVDLALRWQHLSTLGMLTWRLGVDNATNRRAWQESPYQFGHVYLYPLPPRTWRVSAQWAF
jgi:iron complex outermembrane recepter protein